MVRLIIIRMSLVFTCLRYVTQHIGHVNYNYIQRLINLELLTIVFEKNH
jgi:hypothetical protein